MRLTGALTCETDEYTVRPPAMMVHVVRQGKSFLVVMIQRKLGAFAKIEANIAKDVDDESSAAPLIFAGFSNCKRRALPASARLKRITRATRA